VSGVGHTRPTWSDRIFDRVPLAPVWITLATAGLFTAGFLATVRATGDLERFLATGMPWWQARDPRIVLGLALTAAYLPSARRTQEIATRRNLEGLGEQAAVAAPSAERLRPSAARRRLAGALGLLVIPLTALLVDRDPTLYFRPGYWGPAQFWTYGLATLVCWNIGILVDTIGIHTRAFSALARRLEAIDLFDLERLAPFARQGLGCALPGLVVMAFFALNAVDRGFLWAIGVLGSAALVWSSLVLAAPVRAIHARIREAKRLELARVDAAIRGDPVPLRASAIAARADSADLTDLLAYRAFVASLREWPFDAPLRARFALYIAIPVGSWLGGAFAERLLDRLL
jgi:hypothetical protein